MKKSLFCLLVVGAMFLGSGAHAQLFEWKASGTINKISRVGDFNNWTDTVEIGDPYTLVFSFDIRALPDYENINEPTSLNVAGYTGLSGSEQIGTTNLHIASIKNITIFSSIPSNPFYGVQYQDVDFNSLTTFTLGLFSSTSGMSGLSLPSTTALTLTDFNVGSLLDVDESTIGDGPSFYASAQIDSFQIIPLSTAPVPEPATYGLMSVGALAGILFLSRRKKAPAA